MRSLHVVVSLLLLVSACTPDGDARPSPPAGPPEQTTITSPPTTVPSASDVYREVAPALGFVQTPLATGSGILISERFLVTNAHVVWPFRSVDVSFVDAPTGTGLPVVAVDWAADLALIDVSAMERLPEPTVLAPATYSSGDRVYLIGFPAEDPESPEPAITSGIISRTRTWRDGGLTFIQSDALISGGQSGGALVDAFGSVIGITSLEIGDGFALALDVSDVAGRIAEMHAGGEPSGVGDRWLEGLRQPGAHDPAAHLLDEAVWMFDAMPGDTILVEAKTQAPVSGSIIGPDGFLETTLDNGVLTFAAEVAGPHFVAIVPDGGFDTRIELVSTVELTPMRDPDHGRVVDLDSVTFGNADYPGDLDWFSIEMSEGDSILITASSPNADMGLYVGPLSDLRGDAARSDSDSGAGVIGADAEVRYTASTTGTHIIGVFDETQFGPGAYALRVERVE